MRRIFYKMNAMLLLLKNRRYKEFFDQLHQWIYSESYSFGLRRDLTIPFEAPQAKIPIVVRQMDKEDIQRIIDSVSASASQEKYWLLTEQRLLNAGIPTGYLATTIDDSPCYMQWLIPSSENIRIQQFFRGIFPLLKPDEALMEGAYTLPAFRGQRIMSSAMAQIAEQGLNVGARWAITFVGHGNIASLKGCHQAGFEPYIVRREKYRFFHKTIAFESISSRVSYPLELSAQPAISSDRGI